MVIDYFYQPTLLQDLDSNLMVVVRNIELYRTALMNALRQSDELVVYCELLIEDHRQGNRLVKWIHDKTSPRQSNSSEPAVLTMLSQSEEKFYTQNLQALPPHIAFKCCEVLVSSFNVVIGYRIEALFLAMNIAKDHDAKSGRGRDQHDMELVSIKSENWMTEFNQRLKGSALGEGID